MLPQIIICNKTMECRLSEFKTLLQEIDSPCSEILDMWTSFFEDFVIMNVGWKAAWILSPENSKKYDLLHPTTVIVKVKGFNWENLTATVTVEGVQEDILLPSILDVPVIEIYPLKIQDYDEIELKIVADWLDKCRYFFNYLWYPWDDKWDVNLSDWSRLHLKNRLQLQYDIRNVDCHKSIEVYVKKLIMEAKDTSGLLGNFPDEVKMEEWQLLGNNYIRQKMIKAELDLFEETEFRHAKILMKQKERVVAPESNDSKVINFVWSGGNFDKLLHFLELVKSEVSGSAQVKVSSSLQETLDQSRAGDMILLSPGCHILKTLLNLEQGGIVKGIVDPDNTVVRADESRRQRFFLESTGSLTLENLTLERSEGTAIRLFQGSFLKIKNCRIESDGNAYTNGIVMTSGCKLEMENCQLIGCGIGVLLQGTASACIRNCTIRDCHNGICISNESHLSLDDVEISSCSRYGIKAESSKLESSDDLKGEIDLLVTGNISDCDVSCKSARLINNQKGNVLIRRIPDEFVIDESSDESSIVTIDVTDTSVEHGDGCGEDGNVAGDCADDTMEYERSS